jgi:hypothetical protein
VYVVGHPKLFPRRNDAHCIEVGLRHRGGRVRAIGP